MTIDSPSQATIKQEVDPSFKAARVTLRPQEWKGADNTHIGGHFRRIFTTGALTTPLAAAGALLTWRWTNPDRSMLLNRVRGWATIGTVFTTAQELSVDIARVNNFTAPDTGGTALELGDEGRKDRSNMTASNVSNVRIATVGALTPGTGTEEQPMGGSLFPGLLNVVGSMAEARIYDTLPGLEHPAVFGRLEGFRLRNRTAFGAAGVVVMTFEIDWIEIPTALQGA